MRTGHCYKKAYELMEKFKGFFTLCHGVCIGRGEHNNGKPFGHAWIENQTMVIDAGTGIRLDRRTYYLIGCIRDVKRFTLEQMYKQANKHGHYGPWNPAIDKAERWIKE